MRTGASRKASRAPEWSWSLGAVDVAAAAFAPRTTITAFLPILIQPHAREQLRAPARARHLRARRRVRAAPAGRSPSGQVVETAKRGKGADQWKFFRRSAP